MSKWSNPLVLSASYQYIDFFSWRFLKSSVEKSFNIVINKIYSAGRTGKSRFIAIFNLLQPYLIVHFYVVQFRIKSFVAEAISRLPPLWFAPKSKVKNDIRTCSRYLFRKIKQIYLAFPQNKFMILFTETLVKKLKHQIVTREDYGSIRLYWSCISCFSTAYFPAKHYYFVHFVPPCYQLSDYHFEKTGHLFEQVTRHWHRSHNAGIIKYSEPVILIRSTQYIKQREKVIWCRKCKFWRLACSVYTSARRRKELHSVLGVGKQFAASYQ